MRSFSIAPRRMRTKSGLSVRDTRPLRAPAFSKLSIFLSPVKSKALSTSPGISSNST
jgi:hypothetical protein